MPNISVLKANFDRLDIVEDNVELYEALLILDQSEFIPIMEEILAGRLDINDLTSFFNKYNNLKFFFNEVKLPMLSEIDSANLATIVIGNIKQSLFNGKPIKEGFIPKDDTDLKFKIAKDLYDAQGISLSDTDIMKIITGDKYSLNSTLLDRQEYGDLGVKPDSSGTDYKKSLQIKLSNIFATKVDGSL